jgi:hypothetical protein
LVEVPGAQLESARGIVEEIRRETVTGLVVRGFLTPDQANAGVAKMRELRAAEQRAELSEDSSAFSLGMTLITSREPDQSDYFERGRWLEGQLPRLFDDAAGFEAKLFGALQTLAAPRTLLRTYLGHRYPQFSIRCVPHDAELRTHSDLEQRSQPAFAALDRLLHPESTVLSYFIRLSAAPTDADRLTLYSIRVDKPVGQLTRERKEQVRRAIEQRYRRFQMPVSQGDLLIFDAGRQYHRVSPDPNGVTERWTLGGFLGFGADQSELYVWA